MVLAKDFFLFMFKIFVLFYFFVDFFFFQLFSKIAILHNHLILIKKVIKFFFSSNQGYQQRMKL